MRHNNKINSKTGKEKQQHKHNNQNGMKIVPIAYAICYTKKRNNNE